MSRMVLVLSLLLLIWAACDSGKPSVKDASVDPKSLYTTHCALCHGADGRKGLAGAKHLPDSKLDLAQRITIITEGRGTMVPYKDVLTPDQIRAVANYTLSFR